MKAKLIFSTMLLGLIINNPLSAQVNIDEYKSFRLQVENLDYQGLNSLYARPSEAYYCGTNLTPDFSNVAYLDSVKTKYSLTTDELTLLERNHFFVSERLSYESFDAAFIDIFNKDLPVFISTDAILHILHLAYDRMLKSLERDIMSKNLEEYLYDLYNSVPSLAEKYKGMGIDKSLEDMDLYVSVAYSLITGQNQPVHIAPKLMYDNVMKAIASEKVANISLFSSDEKPRSIDFSQFKVRGHYVYTTADSKSLEPYFRSMMWLGRTDLYLTKPETTEPEWEKEDIRRMNISVFLLNELHQKSSRKELFQQNEKIINYLVGESDNITIDEYNNYLASKSITTADMLLDDAVYDPYYQGLLQDSTFRQRIMGAIFMVNPNASEPSELPVSFYMAGQRFIIDSEVLSNVVFDRIIYNGKAEWRWMPDPLDALFALGNNDASYFLEDGINTYHYASNLANMRYLIDNKENAFWESGLYDTWLNSIRKLNPVDDDTDYPFFMRTAAWHQQKMNTQLASWTQLRHDNLLYAKPSYTGGVMCSYPVSYVEPYPHFYETIADFCRNTSQFFNELTSNDYYVAQVKSFFPQFAEIMDKLKLLAEKELQNVPFTDDENSWLKSMLVKVHQPECGTPPYTGWFYDLVLENKDFSNPDYLTVDLHTQPTDSTYSMVGRVLHTGIGKINLGTFLIKPSGSNDYVAFTGPFMSYYEKITSDFERMTDQDWQKMVNDGNLPSRPEWTFSFLADNNGNAYNAGKGLPTKYLVSKVDLKDPSNNNLITYFPNPVTNELFLEFIGMGNNKVTYSVYNYSGKQLLRGAISNKGKINLSSCPKGLYLLRVESEGSYSTIKISKE
jgi:hypothetical protein